MHLKIDPVFIVFEIVTSFGSKDSHTNKFPFSISPGTFQRKFESRDRAVQLFTAIIGRSLRIHTIFFLLSHSTNQNPLNQPRHPSFFHRHLQEHGRAGSLYTYRRACLWSGGHTRIDINQHFRALPDLRGSSVRNALVVVVVVVGRSALICKTKTDLKPQTSTIKGKPSKHAAPGRCWLLPSLVSFRDYPTQYVEGMRNQCLSRSVRPCYYIVICF